MTGPEFLSYVKETFKRTDKDSEIYSACTDAIQYLLQGYPFDDYKKTTKTLTVSSGTNQITLPTDFLKQLSSVQCIDTDSAWPLTKLERSLFIDKYSYLEADATQTGVPTDYCIYGGKIYVGPYPDLTTYTFLLDYEYKLDSAISAATTTVPFTSINRKMLKHFTLQYLYNDLELSQLAALHENEGNKILRVLIDKEEVNAGGETGIAYNDF